MIAPLWTPCCMGSYARESERRDRPSVTLNRVESNPVPIKTAIGGADQAASAHEALLGTISIELS